MDDYKAKATVPGIKAQHAIVTPTCQANRTPLGAIQEAVDRLILEAANIVQARSDEYNLHFVLTMEKID